MIKPITVDISVPIEQVERLKKITDETTVAIQNLISSVKIAINAMNEFVEACSTFDINNETK